MQQLNCPVCNSENLSKTYGDSHYVGLILIDKETNEPKGLNGIHADFSICLECKYIMLFSNDIGDSGTLS